MTVPPLRAVRQARNLKLRQVATKSGIDLPPFFRTVMRLVCRGVREDVLDAESKTALSAGVQG
jgi:transcriptional regulator with XRE-family HTH domain